MNLLEISLIVYAIIASLFFALVIVFLIIVQAKIAKMFRKIDIIQELLIDKIQIVTIKSFIKKIFGKE